MYKICPLLLLACSCRSFFGGNEVKYVGEDTAVETGSDAIDDDGDGYSEQSGDCDDADPSVSPNAAETCNGLDDDCDGQVDEGAADAGYVDLDGDEYGADPSAVCGGVPASGDCDDQDPEVHPEAAERCNAVDDDCDGDVDEGLVSIWFADADSDGYGNADVQIDDCDPPDGWVQDASDCDDAEAAVNPGAVEVCDGLDNDCDGDVDDGVIAIWYADADSDGYGDAESGVTACDAPENYVLDNSDCDDANGRANPSAAEVCDSIDNDCDGTVDRGIGDAYYVDNDGDGYGAGAITLACEQFDGLSRLDTDCDDGDGATHPGATEDCDGADNDCDGSIDFGVTITCYEDADGDGYGDPSSSELTCTCDAGWVESFGDCDDADADSYPEAPEVCGDLLDQDCDGTSDDGC